MTLSQSSKISAALAADINSSRKWTVILILGLAAMFSVGLTLSEIFGCG